ncbi:MAG: sigma-70 family RNA polymerase sigma factor, partial [Flavobacteriaceae bacterium]|nr:sigma-70 family RNA polymerase sigma factor [Flavobacteriaceae bacterium]
KREREPYKVPEEYIDAQRVMADGPSKHIEAKERTERIKSAIKELPGDMSTMLFLHYYDDRTIKEISQITGKSSNAVKVALHRGRKRLAGLLSDTNVKAFTHE